MRLIKFLSYIFCVLYTLPFGVSGIPADLISTDSPVVPYPNGISVYGIRRNGLEPNKQFDAFVGIPFAEPPINELRFANPVPFELTSSYNASEEKPDCIQKNYLLPVPIISGSEDCLYLNVYRPTKRRTQLLPVMVYIYGGGFFSGSSSSLLQGPERFMDAEEVILVTFNYRLGPFGFLSTKTSDAPGNQALKDQSIALKWVKTNIKHYGGNHDDITIFGQSAGGSSVHMHMLSPLSKDLFNKAIVMSGNAIAPYNYVTKDPVSLARRHADAVGVQDAYELSIPELVNKLKEQDPTHILEAGDVLKFWSIDSLTTYRTVVEANLPGAFFTKDPIEIIKNNDYTAVPWMTGWVPEEGVVRGGAIWVNQTLVDDLNNRFDELLPQILELEPMSATRTEEVLNLIKDFYFNGRREINQQGLIDLYSHRSFLYPMYESLQYYINYRNEKNGPPVRLYKFAYKGPYSYSGLFTGTQIDFGVSHCDDLIYLFRTPILFPDFPRDSALDLAAKNLVQYYIDFAVGRSHGVQLEECNSNYSGDICQYHKIENDCNLQLNVKKSNCFNLSMVKLWQDILDPTKFND